jgi:hypothetical protein
MENVDDLSVSSAWADPEDQNTRIADYHLFFYKNIFYL